MDKKNKSVHPPALCQVNETPELAQDKKLSKLIEIVSFVIELLQKFNSAF